MLRASVVGIVVVLLVAKVVTGLNNLSTHWEKRTETVTFDAKATKAYEVLTPNGMVEFEGEDDSAKPAEIVALLKAGASTDEGAQRALHAIEVTTDGRETPTCKIGWKWRVTPEPDWSAIVDFTIRAPKSANLKAECHNGRIVVTNLQGDAKLSSHNGRIEADTSGESLDAETDNGEITATFPGRKVNLRSHNGRIAVDLSEGHRVEGNITTHNGVVQVTVGKQTSCELVTKTHHGWRSRRSGKLGAGGEKLIVTTHNGAVLIDDAPTTVQAAAPEWDETRLSRLRRRNNDERFRTICKDSSPETEDED